MPFSMCISSNRCEVVIDQGENAVPDSFQENCLSNGCAGQKPRTGKVAIDIRVIEKEH
jgi:hypothetical protein